MGHPVPKSIRDFRRELLRGDGGRRSWSMSVSYMSIFVQGSRPAFLTVVDNRSRLAIAGLALQRRSNDITVALDALLNRHDTPAVIEVDRSELFSSLGILRWIASKGIMVKAQHPLRGPDPD